MNISYTREYIKRGGDYMKMKRVTIKPVLNGFIAEIGCQTLVFKDIQTVAEELIRYWENPKAVEEEYLKNAVNPL